MLQFNLNIFSVYRHKYSLCENRRQLRSSLHSAWVSLELPGYPHIPFTKFRFLSSILFEYCHTWGCINLNSKEFRLLLLSFPLPLASSLTPQYQSCMGLHPYMLYVRPIAFTSLTFFSSSFPGRGSRGGVPTGKL